MLRGLADVGRPARLRVGHDGSGAHPAWFLKWVRVARLAEGEGGGGGEEEEAAAALFPADLWLPDGRARDGSGSNVGSWVELRAGDALPPDDSEDDDADSDSNSSTVIAPPPSGKEQLVDDPPPLDAIPAAWDPAAAAATAARSRALALAASRGAQPGYKVTFLTGRGLGAGTGARVFFELVGERGSTGVAFVDGGACHPAGAAAAAAAAAAAPSPLASCGCVAGGSGSEFGRGGVASLLFPRLPCVGALRQLRVGTDGRGAFPAWHLRRVEAVHVATGARWAFDCHAWVDARCGYQRVLGAARVADEGGGAAVAGTAAAATTTTAAVAASTMAVL